MSQQMTAQSDSYRQTMSQVSYNRKRQKLCQILQGKYPAGQDQQAKPSQESGDGPSTATHM